MPRACAICQHDERRAIDKTLVSGTPYPAIAAKYGVSPDNVRRHRAHLPLRLVKAAEAAEVADADALLAHLQSLQRRTLSVLDQAEAEGKLPVALMAIAQARANLEVLGKLLGAINDRP